VGVVQWTGGGSPASSPALPGPGEIHPLRQANLYVLLRRIADYRVPAASALVCEGPAGFLVRETDRAPFHPPVPGSAGAEAGGASYNLLLALLRWGRPRVALNAPGHRQPCGHPATATYNNKDPVVPRDPARRAVDLAPATTLSARSSCRRPRSSRRAPPGDHALRPTTPNHRVPALLAKPMIVWPPVLGLSNDKRPAGETRSGSRVSLDVPTASRRASCTRARPRPAGDTALRDPAWPPHLRRHPRRPGPAPAPPDVIENRTAVLTLH